MSPDDSEAFGDPFNKSFNGVARALPESPVRVFPSSATEVKSKLIENAVSFEGMALTLRSSLSKVSLDSFLPMSSWCAFKQSPSASAGSLSFTASVAASCCGCDVSSAFKLGTDALGPLAMSNTGDLTVLTLTVSGIEGFVGFAVLPLAVLVSVADGREVPTSGSSGAEPSRVLPLAVFNTDDGEVLPLAVPDTDDGGVLPLAVFNTDGCGVLPSATSKSEAFRVLLWVEFDVDGFGVMLLVGSEGEGSGLALLTASGAEGGVTVPFACGRISVVGRSRICGDLRGSPEAFSSPVS